MKVLCNVSFFSLLFLHSQCSSVLVLKAEFSDWKESLKLFKNSVRFIQSIMEL